MKFQKIMARAMFFIYGFALLTEIVLIYDLLKPNYWASVNPFVMVYSAIAGGALLALDIILIMTLINKKNVFCRTKLLIIFVIIQLSFFVVGIPSSIIYGDFLINGYCYFMLKAGTIVIYLGRYYMLKAEKEFLMSKGIDLGGCK